jgi:microcystin-dependent protein
MHSNMKNLLTLKELLVIAIFLSMPLLSFSQIGIGVADPHPKAILELSSTDKGILIPRLTTAEREGMATNLEKPADGCMVYDKELKKFFFFDEAADKWIAINPWRSEGSNASNVDASSSGTVTATKFQGDGVIPKGGIIMWSGAVAQIPAGWTLCNGQNGTPNLMDRFIVGAGSTYNVNASGGVDQVSLTINEMPNHSHGGRTGGPVVNGTNDGVDFNHHHQSYYIKPNNTEVPKENKDKVMDDDFTENWTDTTEPYGGTGVDSWNSHQHIVQAEGGGQPFDNRPRYYALAYIMKL